MSVETFFKNFPDSRPLFDAVAAEVKSLGDVEQRVTKSQISFCRSKAFAWVWVPEQYLHRKAAPLVLSLAFSKRNPSPRWKQVVEPARGRFMHHLELYSVYEIDTEVQAWLRAAWEAAG